MKRTFQLLLKTLEKEMLCYMIDNPSYYRVDAYSTTDDKLGLKIAIHLIPITREVYEEKYEKANRKANRKE